MARGPPTLDFTVTLEVKQGSPDTVRLSVSGGLSGSVDADVSGSPAQFGAFGVFVGTPTPVSKFDAWVDQVELYKGS